MKLRLLIVCFVLFSCSNIPQKWSGYVYPNRYSLGAFLAIPKTNSLQECREKAIEMMLEMGSETPGKYKCGLNCGYISNQLPYCQKNEEYFTVLKELK